METSRDLSNRKEIEELIGQLNCPKAVKCYQFTKEKFADAKEIGGAVWLLGCLETNPLECTVASSLQRLVRMSAHVPFALTWQGK